MSCLKLVCIYVIYFSFTVASLAQNSIYPKNEFRAVWIATVANIDWPKQATDSIEKQQNDFIEILDQYKKWNYNAVIVQIRSVGDAFYPTKLAPYSRFLTGIEGQVPKSDINMLTWMVTEAHRRGLEFHAWLNPYRATIDLNESILSKSHDFYKHPDWMIKYGTKFYYNPGLPEVENHLINVIKEVVQNYNIDAIHFDDYFYPYKIDNAIFDDSVAYKKYSNGLSIDDWRRTNINNLVKKVNIAIKQIKPYVKFGISPFGVWRNKSVDKLGSETQAGQTNFDDLYADTMHWDKQQSIDYIMPQLYWTLNHPKASHAVLLDWWSNNTKNVALYIGNGSYKINSETDKNWSDENEIFNQINLARTYINVNGNCYFSAKSLINNKNKNITDRFTENQYKFKAIPAAVPRFKKHIIKLPVVSNIEERNNDYLVTIAGLDLRYIVLYATNTAKKPDKKNAEEIVDKYFVNYANNISTVTIPKIDIKKELYFGITYINFYGNESEITSFSFFN